MVNNRFHQNQRSRFRCCNPKNRFNGGIVKLGRENRLKGRKLKKNPNLTRRYKQGRCNFGAPLNTTSYIIRLRNENCRWKKPLFPCWSGDVVDGAEEQLCVGGYGSMTGLIRVRDDLVCEDKCRSSVGDVDECVEVERRLDSCLSRFEMVLPKNLDDSRIAMFRSHGGGDNVVCEDDCGSGVSDVNKYVEVERRLDSGMNRFEMVMPKKLDGSRIAMFGSDEGNDDVVCEDECESSVSDVDEHVEVERRLDIGLSRFEMVWPKNLGGGGVGGDQSGRIARLKEENVVIKKRVLVIESDIDEMKRRLLCIERKNQGCNADVRQEEVVDMKVEGDVHFPSQ